MLQKNSPRSFNNFVFFLKSDLSYETLSKGRERTLHLNDLKYFQNIVIFCHLFSKLQKNGIWKFLFFENEPQQHWKFYLEWILHLK